MPEGTVDDDSDVDGGMPEDQEDGYAEDEDEEEACATPADQFRARTEYLE